MLISVCIPAYNRSDLLPVLLDSIFSQDYSDFEIIIAEDKSPERNAIARVASEYDAMYPRKIVYAENDVNLGYDANLRRLIELAKGDYIVFMGNDDLMAPGALRAICEAVNNYPNIGVLLRSYASFHNSPEEIVQKFRYFEHDAFFHAGCSTIITFFRRSVFISGMVVRRESALVHSTACFDGTLLYQQHLVGNILAAENGVYLTKILSYHRLGGIPDFGNSATERGFYVPNEQTVESSVHFMRGMLKIAKSVQKNTSLPVFNSILRDIGNYSYPILSIQSNRSNCNFFRYALAIAKLGFWRVPIFYVYAIGLFIFGKNICDRVIAFIKNNLGYAPNIGNIYSGEK
jgi:abequosyltransferase